MVMDERCDAKCRYVDDHKHGHGHVDHSAMNDGMSSIVFVVYHDVLSVFVLLPFFIVGFFR
ncbi:hypothetical protein Hanom_Chr15g01379551 [Helianthus anomalus]